VQIVPLVLLHRAGNQSSLAPRAAFESLKGSRLTDSLTGRIALITRAAGAIGHAADGGMTAA